MELPPDTLEWGENHPFPDKFACLESPLNTPLDNSVDFEENEWLERACDLSQFLPVDVPLGCQGEAPAQNQENQVPQHRDINDSQLLPQHDVLNTPEFGKEFDYRGCVEVSDPTDNSEKIGIEKDAKIHAETERAHAEKLAELERVANANFNAAADLGDLTYILGIHALDPTETEGLAVGLSTGKPAHTSREGTDLAHTNDDNILDGFVKEMEALDLSPADVPLDIEWGAPAQREASSAVPQALTHVQCVQQTSSGIIGSTAIQTVAPENETTKTEGVSLENEQGPSEKSDIPNDEMNRARRRERNNIASRKSRRRRKTRQECLDNDREALTKRNRFLRMQKRMLERQIRHYKEKLGLPETDTEDDN